MSKYTKVKKPPLADPIPMRFEQRAIDEAGEIHNNFQEFVRDALDEKIIKEQNILNKVLVNR